MERKVTSKLLQKGRTSALEYVYMYILYTNIYCRVVKVNTSWLYPSIKSRC